MEVRQQPVGEAVIRFLSGPLSGQVIALRPPVMTLGRDKQCDIILDNPRISRQHASLRWQRGLWMIENLSQTSYVVVDKLRTTQSVLQHNNVVQLGSEVSFVFLIQQPVAGGLYSSQPGGMSATPIIPAPELLGPLPRIGAATSPTGTVLATMSKNQPSLMVSSNVRSEVKDHILDKQVINIGRDPKNDIVIPDPTISAWHAQIVRDGETLYLVHPHPTRKNTMNGLWYQGQRVRGDQPFRKPLVNGDTFRIGDDHGTLVSLVYRDGSGDPEETLPAVQPIPLTGERITIGRGPGNTVRLNHPQVSTHHALVEKVNGGYRIVDTNSTNHVFVNGQPARMQLLMPSMIGQALGTVTTMSRSRLK